MRPACVATLGLFALACHSYPDAPADFKGPFNAETVMQRAFQPFGGREAYRNLASLREIARLTLREKEPATEADFALAFKAPNKLRIEVTAPNLERVLVFNGREGREFSFGRLVREDVLREVQRRLMYLFPLLLFDTNAGTGKEPRLLGTTTLGDQEVLVLETTDAGTTWTAYLAQDTYQLVRLHEETENIALDTYYSDYRAVAGRPIAHRFFTLAGDRKVQEGQLLEAKIGASMDDAIFELTPKRSGPP